MHDPGCSTRSEDLCYGMHWMLNLVCDREGEPSAVLVRGVLIDGMDPRRTNGPGKVTQALGIAAGSMGWC